MIIFQLAIIFTFLAAGEGVVWLTGIPVPSSILGMLMLTMSLQLGIVKLHRVDRAADALVKNLGFFFIPAGIGLMDCLGLLAEQWIPIVGSAAISTAVVLAITGQLHQLTRKFFTRHADSRK